MGFLLYDKNENQSDETSAYLQVHYQRFATGRYEDDEWCMFLAPSSNQSNVYSTHT